MTEILKEHREGLRGFQDAASATLRCRIRTPDGRRIEGNLQIEVKHQPSSVVWKAFRYRQGEHVFRRLPHGDFLVRVNGAGFKPANHSFVLGGSERRIDIVLDPDIRDHLVIDMDAVRQTYAREATKILCDRVDAEPQFRLTTRLMSALMGDAVLTAALTNAPVRPAPIAQWIEAQIRSGWIFRAAPDVADQVIAALVAARMRLFAVACAVFRNPLVRDLCPGVEDEDIRLHVYRFLATLDSPQLDGVHPILVELFEPRRSCVERFLRAVQNEFALRPERGAAVPADEAITVWAPEQFRSVDFVEANPNTKDGPASIAASQFWLIADALAWALGHPSWQQ